MGMHKTRLIDLFLYMSSLTGPMSLIIAMNIDAMSTY